MMKGLRVGVDGVLTVVTFDDSTPDAKRQGMCEQIGCERFDVVRYGDGIDVWVDDEGLYNSTLNAELSVMIRGRARLMGAWFGAGLFLGTDDTTGETRSLTETECAAVVADWTRPRQVEEYRFLAAFLTNQ